MNWRWTFCAVTICLATGCTTATTPFDPDTPSGDLILEAAGSGAWTVECEAATRRGRRAVADIGGRGEAFDVIALRGVISASCTYTSGDAPLVLTLREEGIGCPYGDFDNGICRTEIGAGGSGSFAFEPLEK